MKISDKARKMKFGAYASFKERPKALQLYFALRRSCGRRVTGSLHITPNGFRVVKKRIR